MIDLLYLNGAFFLELTKRWVSLIDVIHIQENDEIGCCYNEHDNTSDCARLFHGHDLWCSKSPKACWNAQPSTRPGGGGRSLYLRQLGETNGQHLRDSARMRCHSPSTKHTGGLRLFSREFPESDLF